MITPAIRVMDLNNFLESKEITICESYGNINKALKIAFQIHCLGFNFKVYSNNICVMQTEDKLEAVEKYNSLEMEVSKI